jgi:uncharacterized protein (TIGR02452 family)
MGTNISSWVSPNRLIKGPYFIDIHTGTGAMGCGAFVCPPEVVSREMKNILLGGEFKGWFKQVVFAVYSSPNNGAPNYNIFKEALDGADL